MAIKADNISRDHSIHYFKLLLTLLWFAIPLLCAGQTKMISGKVISEDLEILPSISITLTNGSLLGRTDTNGIFKIEIPTGTDKLCFSGFGFKEARIKLKPECQQADVIMLYRILYDYISNSKRERLEKRRYRKLSQLYNKAFTKKLFSNRLPCYQREFISSKAQADSLAALRAIQQKMIQRNFDKLKIGDTVLIPYGGTPGEQGTTWLHYNSITVDRAEFECIIKGEVLQKDIANKGLNFTYKVIDISRCKYPNIILDGRNVTTGDTFRYNMKYFKLL